jgi:Polysaccharide lyase
LVNLGCQWLRFAELRAVTAGLIKARELMRRSVIATMLITLGLASCLVLAGPAEADVGQLGVSMAYPAEGATLNSGPVTLQANATGAAWVEFHRIKDMNNVTVLGQVGTLFPALPSGATLFPALPSGATLFRRDDFEDGTVGSSYTSNQCDASNNRVLNDPYAGGLGRVWEGWWDPGDGSVADHATRCEQSQWGVNGPGTYTYRMVFSVPSDSWLPASGTPYWHYRFQFHGANPSTSPPISMWVRHNAVDPSKFQLRFMAGDSTWSQTGWFGSYTKDAWHGVQVHVKWSQGSDGFAQFWVDGQPIITNNGTTTFTGATLRQQRQGTPTEVYLKYGLDAGGGTVPSYVHTLVALAEGYHN